MTTKEKCLVMMHKAAAAKRLSDKVMAKRAEYRTQPSEAYVAGFCKAAEAYGVNPRELMKLAYLPRLGRVKQDWRDFSNGVKGIWNTASSAVKNPGAFATGFKNGFMAPARGVLGMTQRGLRQGFSAARLANRPAAPTVPAAPVAPTAPAPAGSTIMTR